MAQLRTITTSLSLSAFPASSAPPYGKKDCLFFLLFLFFLLSRHGHVIYVGEFAGKNGLKSKIYYLITELKIQKNTNLTVTMYA